MKTSVLLTWEIPENYNPAQPFTVRGSEKPLACQLETVYSASFPL